jgi:hypothetical protein
MRAKPILRLLVLREKHGPFLRYLPGPSCSSRARGCSARVVCGPEATRNPTRGNGRRTQSTTLARAIRLVSRPSIVIHGRRSRVHRGLPHAPAPRGPRQGLLAPEAALLRQAPRRRLLLLFAAHRHHQRSVPPVRLTAPSFFPVVTYSLPCAR